MASIVVTSPRLAIKMWRGIRQGEPAYIFPVSSLPRLAGGVMLKRLPEQDLRFLYLCGALKRSVE